MESDSASRFLHTVVVVVKGRDSHLSCLVVSWSSCVAFVCVSMSSCGRSKEGASTKTLLSVLVEGTESLSALTTSMLRELARKNELGTVERTIS